MLLPSLASARTLWASLLVGAALPAATLACGGSRPPLVSPTPSPELEATIRKQVASASPDSELVGEILRGVAQDRNEYEDFFVEVEAGQCYVFVVAVDAGIEVIDFTIWDAKKDRVGREKKKASWALIHDCPKQTGMHKVQAKVAKGAGHFAVGVFRKGAPARVAEVEPEPTGPAKLDLDAIIAKEASQIAPDATKLSHYSTQGKKNDFYVQLDKGTCYWFIGAGQASVDDFYIYLWDPEKKRIGETKANKNRAQFGHCATVSAMYHVQVKVDDDSDEVRLGIYAKKK